MANTDAQQKTKPKRSITITRKSSFGGAEIPFHILVDGQPAGKLGNGKTITLAVDPGVHRVCVTIPVWNRNNRSQEIAVDLTRTPNVQLVCGYRAPSLVYLQQV